MTLNDIMFKMWNQHQQDEEEARLKNVQKLIDFYNGEHKSYLKKYLKLKDLDDFPYYETNITKRIIRKLAEVYKMAPIRYFGDKINDKYEKVTKIKNIRMKTVERQSKLLGIVGVRPIVKQYGKEKVFDYILLRSFTAYLDGIKPIAIKYLIADNGQERFWEYWTNESHYVLDKDNIPVESKRFGYTDEGENIYGIIPFIWCQNDYIIDDFYNTSGNSDDLINANEQIDLMLSEMCHKYRYAAFNPIYITGNFDDKDVDYGYNKILHINDPEGSVGTLNINHTFTDDIEAIKFQIQLIERNNGLNINWGISGNTSGFSLVIQNIDHQDDLLNMIDVCRNWEEELILMEKVVGAKDGIQISDKDFRVDFHEVDTPLSIEEQNRKWQFEFDNELASKSDYLKAQNPDMTDEQIEAKLKEISKEKVLLKTEQRTEPTVTDLFNA